MTDDVRSKMVTITVIYCENAMTSVTFRYPTFSSEGAAIAILRADQGLHCV